MESHEEKIQEIILRVGNSLRRDNLILMRVKKNKMKEAEEERKRKEKQIDRIKAEKRASEKRAAQFGNTYIPVNQGFGFGTPSSRRESTNVVTE